MAIPEKESSALLTLPMAIRTIFYDHFFSSGYTIHIALDASTTISDFIPLLRTCHQLHSEVSTYLDSRPITIFCIRGQRLNVLHGVPSRIRCRAEVLVIEDNPFRSPELHLLPGLKCICFCDVYQSTYRVPATELLPTPLSHTENSETSIEFGKGSPNTSASPSDIAMANLPIFFTSAFPSRSLLLPLRTNNEALKVAHDTWKTLRIGTRWIRDIWKNHPEIRVILRRVEEVAVIFPKAQQNRVLVTSNKGKARDVTEHDSKQEDVVFSYHSVVDAATQSIIAKRYLPTRAKPESDGEGVAFEYGAQNWWRREHGWKSCEEAIA